MTIADELKAWRTRMHLSQEEAARLLEVPVATIRNWEQGRNEPRGASLKWVRLTIGTQRST